jgi:hypothetical protein
VCLAWMPPCTPPCTSVQLQPSGATASGAVLAVDMYFLHSRWWHVDKRTAACSLACRRRCLAVVQGRAKPKLNVSEAEQARRREAITGFGSGGGITANGQPAAAGPRVIPKQQDSFVVGVGRTRDAGSAVGSAAPTAGGGAEPAPSRQGGGARAADSRQPGGRQRIPSFIPDRDDGTVGNVEDRFAVSPS